jgi:hypothetical protein
MTTRESLIRWVSAWVPDAPEGQRARFVEALTFELRDWREPERKPRFCKHCPFAEHLHDGQGSPAGCPGFEADAP